MRVSCYASFAAPVWPQACARVGDLTIFFKERVVMLRTACSRVSTGLSVLSVLMIFSTSWVGAQSPSGQFPRKLTLAQAEDLLVRRNLAVLAARYKIDSSRAARLIAGYKPNPMLRIGAEQFPF